MTPESKKILAMCEFKNIGDLAGNENARLLPIIKALLSDRERLREAIQEHVECEPGMYGNECVGLGAAEGLEKSLTASQATDDLILKGERE